MRKGLLYVWASSFHCGVIQNHFSACFGRNEPETTIAGDLSAGGYLLALLLSEFHSVLSSLGLHTGEAYNLGCLGHIASAVWLNVRGEAPTSPLTALMVRPPGIEPGLAGFTKPRAYPSGRIIRDRGILAPVSLLTHPV